MLTMNAPLEESYRNVKDELTRQAPRFTKEEHHANGRISRTEPCRRNRKERIARGGYIPLGACEAQEVAIGEFRFVAIDYGYTFRASESLERETKNIDNREPNRCELPHLVDGTQWARMKRHQGIPEKQKVLLEVDDWGGEEISQSKEAAKWCEDRDGRMASELRSLSQDLVNVGHGRDYRGLAVVLHDIMITSQVNVRVFDLRTGEAGWYELRVTYFQTPGGSEWPLVGLQAFKHHMRWCKACAEILSAGKRGRGSIFESHLQVLSVEGWETK